MLSFRPIVFTKPNNPEVPKGIEPLPRDRRVNPPRLKQRVMMTGLVSAGVVAMGLFIYWFANPDHIGNPWLFWPLTLALGYKFLRMLFEWYHYVAIDAPPLKAPQKQWKVDMITTFVPGEPYDMVIGTLKAMKAVDYPHEVYLCDEGNDPYLKKVCAELGVHHIYRGTDKTGAKAGNINYCLEHHATGEIVAIIDPDHVPTRDALDRILGYFEDPEIGFVQTIQAYSNRNESFIAKAAAQQTYHFYGPIQMGMHHYGTAQAIGANCVFRRAALDSIGGHAPGLAEDLHTSMKLHAQGWRSAYVPEQITRGLAPADLPAYFKQQLKWARGVFELWFFALPGLFTRLNWRQRIHYSLLPMYYLVGFFTLIDILVPAASLFLAEVPWKVDLVEFGLVIAPVIIILLLTRQFAQRWVLERHEQGFHMLGGILRNGTWWVFILGFIYTLLRIRVPYIPTPKENQVRDSWMLSLPNILAILLSLVAIIVGLNIDWSPYSLAMAGFSGVNMVILGMVVGISQQRSIKRFYQALYGGSLSKVRKRWFAIRTSLLFPLLRKGYVILALLVATIGLVLSFTILKPPMQLADIYSPVIRYDEGVYLEMASGEKLPSSLRSQVWPIQTWSLPIDGGRLVNGETTARVVFGEDQDSLGSGYYQDSLWITIAEKLRNHQQPVFFQPFSAGIEFPQKQKAWIFAQQKMRLLGDPALAWVWPFTLKDTQLIGDIPTDWYLINSKDISAREFQAFLDNSAEQLKGRWMLDLAGSSESAEAWAEVASRFQAFLNVPQGIAKALVGGRYRKTVEAGKLTSNLWSVSKKKSSIGFPNTFEGPLRGISYFPSRDWQSANKPLTRYRVRDDFKAIKKMGGNAIRRHYASIYDWNVLAEAERSGLGVLFGFHISPDHDFLKDQSGNQKYRDEILEKVADFKESPALLAWIIGDDIPRQIKLRFQEPYRSRVLGAFFHWLNDLSFRIHQLDSSHPVVITASVDSMLPYLVGHFEESLPMVDMLGINAYSEQEIVHADSLLGSQDALWPYFYSAVAHSGHWQQEVFTFFDGQRIGEPSDYQKASSLLNHLETIKGNQNPNCQGAVVYTWQDRLEGTATWYGLTDYRDRRKPAFHALKGYWTGEKSDLPLADTYISGPYYMPKSARYKHQFVFPVSENLSKDGIRREWYVCREELLERVGELNPEGKNEKRLRVILPEENSSYRIYLHLYDQQGNVSTASYPLRKP